MARAPGQGSLKVGNSGLQDGKLTCQFIPEGRAVPPGESGIKLIERLKNDCTELGRGGSVSDVALNSEAAQDGNKRNDDVEVPSQDVFLLLLPFWMVWMSAAFT